MSALNKPPFHFDSKSGFIRNANKVPVMAICSWVHLTETLQLSLAEAAQEQTQFGLLVEHMLNRQEKDKQEEMARKLAALTAHTQAL